jgi:hypothetical protein
VQLRQELQLLVKAEQRQILLALPLSKQRSNVCARAVPRMAVDGLFSCRLCWDFESEAFLKLTPLMTAEESEEDLRQRVAFSRRRDEG